MAATRFLALSTDSEAYWLTTGRGTAHVLVLDSPERPGGDVLCHATDGKIRTGCGRTITVEGGESGISGARCSRCDKIATDSARIDASRAAWAECNREDASALFGEDDVTEQGNSARKVADRKRAVVAEREDSKKAQRKRAARREAEAKAIARVTDGKCAVLITDPDSESGRKTLLPLRGRLAQRYVAAISEVAPSVEWIQVDANSYAVAPRPGTDEDQIHGVCPFCHERITLTGKAAIGTHRVGGVTPDGPPLSGRALETAERDASKRRDVEAYREEPIDERRVRVVPVVETADAAPIGSRDHGRSDGPALLPLGETGYAGVKFDNESDVGTLGTVGGRYGYLTPDEFTGLTRSQRRRYWKHVKANKDRAAKARKITRGKSVAEDRVLPAEVSRRKLRKDASTGRSDEGHTLSHYGKAPATAVTPEAALKAAGVKNGGRGMAKSPRV